MKGTRRRTHHRRRRMRGGIGYGEIAPDASISRFANKTADERKKELSRIKDDRADRSAHQNAAVSLSGKLFPGSTASSTRTSRASSTAGRRRTRRRHTRRRR
jgi:hypothetical protein